MVKMPLKAIVDNLEDVEEAHRGFYQEKNGKHFLAVEPVDGFGLEDVGGLKNTLGKEMTKRKELEKLSKKFEGLDPDKAREAIEKYEEFGNLDPRKEADKIAQAKVDAITKQMVEKHLGELKSREDRSSQLTRKIETLLIDQVATAAVAEADGNVRLLLPIIRGRTRVVENDGEFSVEVMDEHGITQVDGEGKPVKIAGLVASMKGSEEFGQAFRTSGAAGSGKQPSASNGGSKPQKAGDIGGSKKDRVAALTARFPELAAR
jgi:hypothetical protein